MGAGGSLSGVTFASGGDDTLSYTLSGIPADATLSNSNHDVLTISGGSITLTQAQLVSYKITQRPLLDR